MEHSIRLAQIEDSEAIIDLLNQVTLHLNKKGIQQWRYPWTLNDIQEDMENKYIYILMIGNVVVGTFSIKNLDYLAGLSIEPNSKYLFRIAILPQYHGKGLGIQILHFCYQYIRSIQQVIYLDCWAGNQKLREFYTNNALTYMGDYPEEDYYISVFRYQ